MTSIPFLVDGAGNTNSTIIFAHGAGAPMDSPFMDFYSQNLALSGHQVVRFEFPYMAERRSSGKKRPPDKMEKLLPFFQQIADSQKHRPLFLAGKSLGGRVASLIADQVNIAGFICLGYPFHPVGKPEKTRTDHLATLKTPGLILQGTRDPFGTPDEVAGYHFSQTIKLHWVEDGDHDLVPRKRSGRTKTQNWEECLQRIDSFIEEKSQ
ncbi:alpha/beta hydrolase [Kiloniella laminariae]|uniref:Alpha/beta hydrolase n=1 Tax=Kiloniella laminariae TaxID=454162 RepID=A0ABT4LI39_9PROT|nr:alpha/beta family hydrolase [Kiloniella laminariae]MCZ4280774.1 alpha/beta hydrolase [Kiloniella laminariae]